MDKKESNSEQIHPQFYIYEDDTSNDVQRIGTDNNDNGYHLRIPKLRSNVPKGQVGTTNEQNLVIDTNQGITEATGLLPAKEHVNNINDILRFPIESSHAYSYAHLSPNSLALRLNVLKRSLDILKDRPALLRLVNLRTEEQNGSVSSTLENPKLTKINNRIYSNPLANNSSEFYSDKFKVQSNASSAALSALFRPPMKRSDSLPVNQVYSTKNDLVPNTPKNEKDYNTSLPKSSILNDDLKDIIALIENDTNNITRNSYVASTLHDLSLPSTNHNQKLKHDFLKNKLLYALATPFVETSSILGDQYTPVAPSFNNSASSLNSLNKLPPATTISSISANRPFHSITLGKHALPQSVFTVDTESPWSVKAANDLALLMFGVLQGMIKSLTLMDLIAPQFREFVAHRLNRLLEDEILSDINNQKKGHGIIFAGEIVAIMRPGDQEFAWTSMWAKKRGNLIICMFEQIPCDAFDVVILCNKDKCEPYKIDSFNEVAGKLIREFDTNKFCELADISVSMDSDLQRDKEIGDDDLIDHYLPQDINDSEKINNTRYYTLQLNGEENIPCAATSYPLEMHEDKNEVKLKIHSLPYIAGLFVIDSSSYNILSCNNAIAKNLFGKSSIDLQEESINNIIPEFTKILKTGLKNHSDSLDIVPGLVLPEHFFRKYDAILRHSRNEGNIEEELFFSSLGIRGLHRDGRHIWIDVQLRAASNESFVLWITYSRQTGKDSQESKEFEKLSSNTSSLSLKLLNEKTNRGRRKQNGDFNMNEVNLPSQLKLFSDDDPESLELAPSSCEISRETSTRRPKSTTFSIPISHASKALERAISFQENMEGNTQKRKRIVSNTDSTNSNISESAPPETLKSSDTLATTIYNDNERSTSNYNILSNSYQKYSEKEILKLENEMLENKAKNSTRWPLTLGAKRRTKKFSEFKVIKEMGEGAYGKVVLAEHKEDPIYKIIIKCIDKERILVDTWVRDRKMGTICSEIQIMAFLNHEPHPNIMRIIDFFEDEKYYYLETPLFGDPPAIDLFDFIEIKKNMTELECRFIFKQIVLSIYHLHKHGIAHRDIKDENVIVDENGLIKLIDFGSAGYTKLGPFDVFVGTIDYASPEVLRGEKYEGKPQDIWALGILLYTMLYQENPFYNVDEIMEGELRIPYVVSNNCTKLIKKILVRDVSKRPTITDIVEDDWLNI